MAMIAIPVGNDISTLFKSIDINIHKDSCDHITMFYLGDNIPISRILKIIPIIFEEAERLNPFDISCSKVTTFPKGNYGYPVIANLQSEKLHELRESLKKAFGKNKIKWDDKFPEYKPHLTLGYCEEKVEDIKIDKVKWTVSCIGLYGGDTADSRLFVRFPFSIGKNKTSSYVERFVKCARS